MIIPVILAGLGGLIYGSFLNVLLWRWPEGKGIGGRSHCCSCNHALAWYDLVPVISYLLLRGRCRYCRQSIHVRYPLIELSVAMVLGVFFFVRVPVLSLETIITVIGLLVLISLFFFDLFYFILPDIIVLPAIIIYALYDITQTGHVLSYLLTALLVSGFFAILYIASRSKGLGFGDVKLVFLMGLILGYPLGLVATILGIWLATIVSIGLLLSKKMTRKSHIPLGSFLAIATIYSIIFFHETFPFISFFR